VIDTLAPIVSKNIPEYLRGESPLFKAFVELYYAYADQKSSAGYQILNADVESDIDTTSAETIDKFYETYGADLPRSVALDRRNLVKILNKIYEAKGTEKAIKLLFRTIFNDEVTITYPGEQRLKASDGVWVREKYITLRTIVGALPQGQFQLSISNDLGNFTFEATRFNEIPGGYVRIFFQSYFNIFFNQNQRIFNFSDTGSIVYAGDIVPSPSYLEIVSPGKGWQKGQTFTIPGSYTNTLVRVTEIGPLGEMVDTEVIDYGFNHSVDQIVTISPYPIKPATGDIYVESVMTSVSPVTYTHTLVVNEPVKQISEHIFGYTSGVSGYFSEDYVDVSYVALSVVNSAFTQDYNPTPVDTDLSITEWEESRTTLVFRQENIVTTRGYFENDNSQLSNQFIKLQDNYFYQSYSYLIKTSKDVTEYSNLMKIVHPAGLKQFANLSKTSDLDITGNYDESTSVIENITH
jgi:hypothetical protein